MHSYTELENLQIVSCLCMHLISLNNLIGPSTTELMSEYVVLMIEKCFIVSSFFLIFFFLNRMVPFELPENDERYRMLTL